MKQVIFLLAFFLPLASVWGQSITLTDFVGTFTFSDFSAGGTADVQGDLNAFNDQTTQYFASDIEVGDVIWDNQGNRWEVMVVNSSNLTQANVDLRDINSAGGAPFGVGYVSRETPTIGLSLFSPDNNIGISQQLKSRVESHNALLIDEYISNLSIPEAGRDTVYNSGQGFWVYGTLGVETTSGSQGNYTVSIPDSARVLSIWVEFGDANDLTVGGEVIVTVNHNTSDYHTSFANALDYTVLLKDSGGVQRNPGDVSITVSTTTPSAGSATTTIANLNGLGFPSRAKLQF